MEKTVGDGEDDSDGDTSQVLNTIYIRNVVHGVSHRFYNLKQFLLKLRNGPRSFYLVVE